MSLVRDPVALGLGRGIEALQPVVVRESKTTRSLVIGAMVLNLLGFIALLALR